MLPKQHRLRRSGDFVRVRRQGRTASTRLLAISVLPTRSAQVRVGFSVSRKVGKAAVRNRVRRRLREAVRHQLPDLVPGYDLVLSARADAAVANYADICEAVRFLLTKTGVYRSPVRANARA